jgi:hypothetical protein
MKKLVVLLIVIALVLVSAPAAMAMAQHGERGRSFAGYTGGEVTFDFSNPKGCTFAPLTTVTTTSGFALHMGRVTTVWSHCFVPFGDPEDNLSYVENATVVITAANDDELWGTYEAITVGTDEIGEKIVSSGTVTFDGGTGRFENATGSGRVRTVITFEGFGDPAWPARTMWIGRLDY